MICMVLYTLHGLNVLHDLHGLHDSPGKTASCKPCTAEKSCKSCISFLPRRSRHANRPSKKSRPDDMRVRSGHIQGNLALRVCEPLCGECAVQRQILSPGGYQGAGISVPRMRAEMGSPWSVALLRHAETPPGLSRAAFCAAWVYWYASLFSVSAWPRRVSA